MTPTFSNDPHPPVKEKCRQDDLTSEVSLSIAQAIRADPHTCFDNVLDMFKAFPGVLSAHAQFVEGWYVVDLEDEVVINEHGWCELPNGRIIDPTVVVLIPPSHPVYYFAGVKRSWQEVKDILRKKDAWFPYVRAEGTYGKDGLQHPGYNAAHEAATQKVFSLANARRPGKQMTFLTAQDMESGHSDEGDAGILVQMLLISPEHDREEPSDA